MPRINLVKFDSDDNSHINQDNDMIVDSQNNDQNRNLRVMNFESQDSTPPKRDIQQRSKNNRNNKKPPKKTKKKKSFFKKFITAFFIALSICIFLISSIFFAYNRILSPSSATNNNIKAFNGDNSKYTTNTKDRYNFAIFGVDTESTINPRTDFMMIGSYDRINNRLNLMSVPRDTLVYMPEERIQFLEDNDIPMIFPSSGKMKLNEVNHFATDEYGTSFLLAQLEEMFQIDFDFYVKFDLDGFKYLVDAIGGVPFNVPQRMYYNDPDQGLYIDLLPGEQVLNGDQAEGVVRYRHADAQNPISNGYARGDLDRINVQQDFILAFIEQLSSLDNLTSTLPAILQTASKYCETNFNLKDLPIFLPFLTDFNEDNIEFFTMPNEEQGGYLTIKEPDCSELIDYMFYTQEAVDPISSIGLNIEILNGTYIDGLATQAKEILEADGYTISSIGDSDEKLSQTKIYVKDRAYGQDLKRYFNTPKIVNDPTLDTDIKIILGSSGS